MPDGSAPAPFVTTDMATSAMAQRHRAWPSRTARGPRIAAVEPPFADELEPALRAAVEHTMPSVDEAEHARLRRLVTAAFTGRGSGRSRDPEHRIRGDAGDPRPPV